MGNTFLLMKMINTLMARIIARYSPKMYLAIAYLHNRHKLPDFKNPRDISEYWLRLILSEDLNKIAYLADKYLVRDYVAKRGLENILPKLLGVWNSAYDIDFYLLPNMFALKMNFGAAMNIICMNKNDIDYDRVRAQLTSWLNSPIYNFAETHYNFIERKIICEEFISGNNGHFPNDYKFMCFNGIPFCVLACSGRDLAHAEYLIYDLDWNLRPEYMKDISHSDNIKRPKHLEEMVRIASRLSAGLSMVRVDLYDTDEKVLFGEMTLTPAGGIFHRWSQKAIDDMGKFYHDTK